MKRMLNRITKTLSAIEGVKAVVLYGSIARGDHTSRSGIELLILTTERRTSKEVEDKIIALEQDTSRNIQPTIRTLEELQKTDTGLLQDIFQKGKVLYLKEAADIPSAMLLQQKPFLVYTFQLNSLSQKEKARFNRQLYEHTKKGYKYKGLLQELGGQKVSAGCIPVPHTEKLQIEKLFKQFKVQFNQPKVWK